MEITRGKMRAPQKVVIYGPEGIGKSTLAAAFPNPIFIDTEGSTSRMDVARTPRPTSWTHFKTFLLAIKKDQQGFDTVVIDTLDWAERLCIRHVCAVNNISSLGGSNDYGRSYNLLEAEWGSFLDIMTELQGKGLHVALIAHAHMRKFEQPEEAGAYDRWEMKLAKKCAPLVKEWADMILFCNYKTIVVEIDGKRKAQGGERTMYTTHHPCWDAKNRHDLLESSPLDFKFIASCFQHPKESMALPETPVTKEPVCGAMSREENAAETEVAKESVSHPPSREQEEKPLHKFLAEDDGAFPNELYDLMTEHDVSEQEIKEVVAKRGYYPIDTSIGAYKMDFVQGVLVAAWDKVFAAIKQNRNRKQEA